MRGSGKTTAAARETIRRLTLAGRPQKKIAAETRLNRVTIWKVQRELKLPQRQQRRPPLPLPKATKKSIARLLARGLGRRAVAKSLGIGEHAVSNFILKIGHRKPRLSANCRYNLSPRELRAIRQALFDSERRIAKRFHVRRTWLAAFRLKKFWGCR